MVTPDHKIRSDNVAYQIVPFPMTLGDLQGHSVIASFFKCDFCTAMPHLTRFQCRSASLGPSAIAERSRLYLCH